MAALDVAVCCSDFEGGPLSVMEYMRAGIPVVATRVGGFPSSFAEGEPGLRSASRAGGARRRDGVLGDPGRARELGEAGRERQRAEYDIGVWARRLEELYEKHARRLSAGRRFTCA